MALRLGDVARRGEGDQDGDRHVDEEDPAPVEVLGEQAAGQQADRRARTGHRGEHAEGPVAFGPLVEVGGDQGEGRRRADRAADALECAGGQQHAAVLREAAEQRGQPEQQSAGDEDPSPAEDVARASAEQQQAAEGERVGVDHP